MRGNRERGMGLDPHSRILEASNGKEAGIGSKSGAKPRIEEGWENIPPYRQLKVLLVEDDDSTRHVVCALLRNCGYQVVPAANGVQAWSLLDDRKRDFDLVLTDVVMPGLSGMGLLSRIMHHENHKKIPVVMMSSHDSTNVVFKCLSKGAADFLVKPVRKNELRNLWQHAWRRSQSSSGSESETGRVDRRGGGSSDESGSDEIRISDQSDNGSAQSSCTKKVAELVESPRKSLVKTNAYPPSRRGCRPKDSERVDDFPPKFTEETEAGALNTETTECTAAVEAADLLGTIASGPGRKPNEEAESEMGGSNSPEGIRDGSSSDPTTSSRKLELSLRSSGHAHEPNLLLKQSAGPSAFSRYNTPGGCPKPQLQGYQQEEQQQRQQQQEQIIQDRQEQMFSATTDLPLLHSPRTINGAENRCGTPAKDGFFARPEQQQHLVAAPAIITHPVQYAALVSYDQSLPARGGAAYYYAQPALPPWQHAFSPQAGAHSPEILEQQQRNFQAFTNILAHHHHYHIEHHHHAETGSSSRDVSSVAMETPGCGSTNVGDQVAGMNGLSKNSYGNGSVSGSNHGSNNYSKKNETNANINNAIVSNNNTSNTNNNNLSCCNAATGDSNLVCVPFGSEHNSKVRREAALNKFRQKRKERCFEKKVRYQSRKRLAEQRPRVRGQFVSQAVYDSSVTNVPM